MYTVAKLARILDLHPKTVRRFISEGRIKAQKIGREWRVSEQSLEEFAHGELAGAQGDTPSFEPAGERVRVSAAVELAGGSPEEISRISDSLVGALSGKDPELGSASYDLSYRPETGRAVFTIRGSMELVGTVLSLLQNVVDDFGAEGGA